MLDVRLVKHASVLQTVGLSAVDSFLRLLEHSVRLSPLISFRIIFGLLTEVYFSTIWADDLRFCDDVSCFCILFAPNCCFCWAARHLFRDVYGRGVRLVDRSRVRVLAELRFVLVNGGWGV